MDLKKLNPWNWFKHEDAQSSSDFLPVKRDQYQQPSSVELGHPVVQFHREVDRLFEDVFRSFGMPSLAGRGGALWPTAAQFNPELNVSSDDETYHISLEAPGLEKGDIDIEIRDNRLVISGHKDESQESKDQHFYRIERRYGAFQRVLALPEDVVHKDISAAMKNGVLSIRLPRSPSAVSDARKVDIRSD